MYKQLKVTICQTDIRWADVYSNIQAAERLITGCLAGEEQDAGADRLFVLPEMWATGFGMRAMDIAEEESLSAALSWMHGFADKHGVALAGSLPIRLCDGTCRNRLYFVKPGQTDSVYYDKHHLFTYGCEQESYVAGGEHTIVEWGGLRLLLLVCYDLRFPVWSRYGYAGEFDGIIYVANWPEKRQIGWDTLTRARAIENQCYVMAVNRVGADPITSYAGGSRIIDATGKTLAECDMGRETTATATLSPTKLRERRDHFRVLPDRDNI